MIILKNKKMDKQKDKTQFVNADLPASKPLKMIKHLSRFKMTSIMK